MVVAESELVTPDAIFQFVSIQGKSWQAAQNELDGYLPFATQLVNQFETLHQLVLTPAEQATLLTLFYMAIDKVTTTLPDLDRQPITEEHQAFFLITFIHVLEDIKLMLHLINPEETHRATKAIDVTSLNNWVELITFMPLGQMDQILT